MKKAIVSANYFDRSTRNRWIMRRETDESGKALAYPAIVAKGVTFRNSNASEEGFGCTVVAFCKEAEGVSELPAFNKKKCVRLQLVASSFYDMTTREKVETVSKLYLDTDGYIYAVLPTHEQKMAAEQKHTPLATSAVLV